MKKKVIFIINKNSGTKRNITENKILSILDKNIEPLIFFTNNKDEAEEILKKYDNEKYFVAGGGDGTVNFIVSKILDTEKSLFILPLGSGNSTARHLGIPMGLQSLKRLKNTKKIKADIVSFENRKSLSVSGIGFDGEISKKFENLKIRGLKSYILVALKSYLNFKPFDAKIKLDEKNIIDETNIIMISIANTNQFGNNAFIAPKAKINDGKINVCVLKKPPFYKIPIICFYLFSKKIHKSKYYKSFSCEKVEISTNKDTFSHTDGEPINEMKNKYNAQITNFINLNF